MTSSSISTTSSSLDDAPGVSPPDYALGVSQLNDAPGVSPLDDALGKSPLDDALGAVGAKDHLHTPEISIGKSVVLYCIESNALEIFTTTMSS